MTTTLNYRCPKCSGKISKEVDLESNIVHIICPTCGHSFTGNVKKTAPKNPDVKSGSSNGQNTSSQVKEEPKERVLDNSQKDVLPAEKSIVVGEDADIVCPHCKQLTHIEKVDNPVMKILTCDKCKGPIEVNFRDPTKDVSGAAFLYRGKIQIVHRFFFKKDFPLRIGTNIIGRADKSEPSDIQLNDETVSRRSVEIEVKVSERGGFFFHFRVLKSTNPVLVNSQRINPGNEILLNYGDIITMGRTQLRFDKIV